MVLLLLVLAGCIQTTIRETLSPSGNSHVTVSMDFSRLAEMGSQTGTAFQWDSNTICDQILNPSNSADTGGVSISGSASFIQKLSNVDCEAGENFTVMITGTYQHSDEAFTKQETLLGTTYSFNPQQSDLMEFPTNGQSISGFGGQMTSLAALRASGFSTAYTIEMPGTITKAQNGTIENNKAVFDLVELGITGQAPLVESTEYNFSLLLPLGGGILLVIIVAIFLLLRKQKKGKETREKPLVQPSSPRSARAPVAPSSSRQSRESPSPRRLRRFERKGETPPSEQSAEPKWGLPPNEFEPDSFNVPSRDLRAVYGEPEKNFSRRKRQGRGSELDTLARDLSDQSLKEEKTHEEIEELRQKLESLSGKKTVGTSASTASNVSARERHKLQRQKEKEGEEEKPLEGSETQETAEQLQKMEFKDLLAGRESEEEESESRMERELKELGGGEKEEPIEKCPNCKKETQLVLYCPNCGTGFCSKCASSFKKTGAQEYYVCPTCQTPVKSM